jgi:uroporphyrinogen-III decarboxylase
MNNENPQVVNSYDECEAKRCSLESEIQKRKDRWTRVMNGQKSPKHLLMVRYDKDMEGVRPGVVPLRDNVQYRTERAWEVYQKQMARMEWLKDDAIPYLDCMTGTEVFAECFGCRVHVPKGDMPFARPLVRNAQEAQKVKVPGLDAPPLKRAFDMADELVRRAGKGALVRPIDIQSPMDIAALVWEKGDFLMAMVDSPEAVKELAYKCRQLLTTFLDEWHRRYGQEHIAHYPDYYMPTGMTLSEDEIGVVNNEMFEEFFLPELVYLSDHFGAIGIHCCADSKHQWKSFGKIPNLKFLNLKYRDAYEFFGDGQIIQQHGQSTPEQWDAVIRDYPTARLYIDVKAQTKDEAMRLVEKYRSI